MFGFQSDFSDKRVLCGAGVGECGEGGLIYGLVSRSDRMESRVRRESAGQGRGGIVGSRLEMIKI